MGQTRVRAVCKEELGERQWPELGDERWSGTPGGTRTPDARLRTPPLYPLSYRGITSGGDRGARTPNLGVANAALSQLSYIPGLGDSATIEVVNLIGIVFLSNLGVKLPVVAGMIKYSRLKSGAASRL